MSENFLSQEEIDTLLGNGASAEEQSILDDTKKDIIGEVGNISMSTAATALSFLLNKQVLITTPRVSWIPFQKVIDECNVPKVVASVKFKSGLSGDNLLMVDIDDAAIIADLMMGGEGNIEHNKTLSELEMSAVAEAMNQMIGSASTSMSTMLKKSIDILPPNVELWDTQAAINYTNISNDHYICKIAFNLNIEGLINSEIMQIFTGETVEEISNIMLNTDDSQEVVSAEIVEGNETKEDLISAKRGETDNKEDKESNLGKIIDANKPVFQELKETVSKDQKPRNLDLIMDVPLEFSVVLGKTKMTIKEILSFRNGSVVQLNKLADEPLEIYVNGKLVAQGEVVVINENFGIRITNILSKEERVQNLNG